MMRTQNREGEGGVAQGEDNDAGRRMESSPFYVPSSSVLTEVTCQCDSWDGVLTDRVCKALLS